MDGREVVDALVLRGTRGVGDRGFKLLVERFGSARAVLEVVCAAVGPVDGLPAALMRSIRQATESRGQALREAERAETEGYHLIPFGHPAYPSHLAQIHDPPAVLYLAGDLEPVDQVSVALVGSRRASVNGARFARRLAGGLASVGVTVVSGLAQGVDAAAHLGALEAGGRTLAVFGSGVDVVHPRRNAELARRVRSQGAWLSELPLGSAPLPHHFPRRNRIISGLSLGVVVVEAGEGSGSLITAACALEQGREVFAVPGLPGVYHSRGTHRLLRSGAKLVEGVEDVLAELPLSRGPRTAPPVSAPIAPRVGLRGLWEALEGAPLHIDEVAAKAGLEAAQAAAGLMELTLEGLAEEWPGKRYSRRPTAVPNFSAGTPTPNK